MVKYKMSILGILFAFFLYANRLLYSAEKPLGIVTKANGTSATIEFDSSVHLLPGTMVAIHGGGTVKIHPLTDEIVVKDLEHLASVQILEKGGNVLNTRITWKKDGVKLKPGMDAVPFFIKGARNSPPILLGEIEAITVPIQSVTPLIFPINDPDDDKTFFVWELTGEKGRVGFLEAHITRLPENTWFAPGVESKAVVRVTAIDSNGQNLKCAMNLSTSTWDDTWRTRKLNAFRRFGSDVSANSIFLTRDPIGKWWSIANDSIFTISPGWFKSNRFSAKTKRTILEPRALATFNDLFHLLGKTSAAIKVVDPRGAKKRTYGIQSSPSDIVIAPNGVVFVADQGLGGVQVYEPDGMFRSTLGRAGDGSDYFSKLTHLALDRNGQLYALDESKGIIHRFGRFQERLTSWTLGLTSNEVAKDLSWHPNGELLILLNDGRIVRLDEKGEKTNSTIKTSIERVYFDHVGSPESIYVDLSGEIFVTYPEEGILARYTNDGNLYGIRGAPLWGLSRFAVDCSGQIYGCYGSSKFIVKLDQEGWLTEQIGANTKKTINLKNISRLAIASDGRTLICLDSETTHLVRFDLTGSRAPIVFGQPGRNEGQFLKPTDVVIDDYGHSYVLDSKLNRVSVFDRNGQYLFSFGQKGKADNQLRNPTLLAVRPGGQAAYICDGYEIKKFTIDYPHKTATHSSNAGGKGRGPGQLVKPTAIACDRQGLLYVLDSGREDLQVIDYRGKNAISIYSRPYKDWGFQKVSEMTLNVDGQPHLIDSGRFVGLSWEK